VTHAATPGAPSRAAASTDLAWLSVLRVLAITGVVAIHTLGFNADLPGARGTLSGTLAIYLDLGAICAVPLFVMMSGVTLLDPERYAGPGPFLRKRALRLVPPLVFWHIWYFLVLDHQLDGALTPGTVSTLVLTGTLYTALYFFWIIMGLALVSPLLVPYVASVSRRGVLVAGTLLAAMPALSTATREIRGVSLVSVDTPWTWWVPYVGLYLLGQGLKEVEIRRWPLLVAAVVAACGLFWLQGWQWQNPRAPELLGELSPASYYSALTVVYSVLVFLVVKSLVRPGGLFGVLTHGRPARVLRIMGDATLGVFALHQTVLLVVQHRVWADDGLSASGTVHMLARLVLVWGATYAIVLVLRRVRFVRAVL
jgi:surface polysaccharide O-acyltransferase-like enzyme